MLGSMDNDCCPPALIGLDDQGHDSLSSASVELPPVIVADALASNSSSAANDDEDLLDAFLSGSGESVASSISLVGANDGSRLSGAAAVLRSVKSEASSLMAARDKICFVPGDADQPLLSDKIPPVLFQGGHLVVRESFYCDAMSRLDASFRYSLIRKTLRDVPALVEAGFLPAEFGELFLSGCGDDYYNKICVYSILRFVNDLALVGEVSLTTARCYKRWLASYLEVIGHPDAYLVRSWIVPHSNEFYVFLFGFIDTGLEAGVYANSSDVQLGSFTLDALHQLDLFSPDAASALSVVPGDSPAPASGASAGFVDPLDKLRTSYVGADAEEKLSDMYGARNDAEVDSKLMRESAVAEYSYLGSASWAVLLDELTAKRKNGSARYRRGEDVAIIFQATMMCGLRPTEWGDAVLHDGYSDSRTHIHLRFPVLEVFTAKQDKRVDANPLRKSRLLVFDSHTPEQVALIKLGIHRFHLLSEELGSTKKALDSLRTTLGYVWGKIVKSGALKETRSLSKDVVNNGVSLYTARHVFAEELRRSLEYTKFDVAVLLGHTTTANQVYYTSRKVMQGRSYDFQLPVAWPGDAREVEVWSKEVLNTLRPDQLRELSMKQDKALGGVFAAETADEFGTY